MGAKSRHMAGTGTLVGARGAISQARAGKARIRICQKQSRQHRDQNKHKPKEYRKRFLAHIVII